MTLIRTTPTGSVALDARNEQSNATIDEADYQKIEVWCNNGDLYHNIRYCGLSAYGNPIGLKVGMCYHSCSCDTKLRLSCSCFHDCPGSDVTAACRRPLGNGNPGGACYCRKFQKRADGADDEDGKYDAIRSGELEMFKGYLRDRDDEDDDASKCT